MGIQVAGLWSNKAQQWLKGREGWMQKMQQALDADTRPSIWVHCSSLGEFEQGRTLIDNLKLEATKHRIILTFFSPSGYEIRKEYGSADHVFYLPLDSATNAKNFLNIVNPTLAIFIKYDFWFHYLKQCHDRKIPLLLVSAIFRKSQPFFKWYGALHRRMLGYFNHFFVQDERSKDLLQQLGMENVTVSGDTRFDRVLELATNPEPLPLIEDFCGDDTVMVAGSTWPRDERIIREAISHLPQLKLIIAPHEIDEKHLGQVKSFFPNSIFYSEYSMAGKNKQCLIIDNIGMLSRLYKYANITYVGGGFNKGIHNTLEAAVYSKPVLFGPKFEKFLEAREMIKLGGACCVQNAADLYKKITSLTDEEEENRKTGTAAGEYVRTRTGATGKVMNYIQMNRLLTSW
jgi:3-deoxy-D-manno-octulosonic-acid transferase